MFACETRIRLKPENEESGLYRGKTAIFPVSMNSLLFIEDAALWYLEFCFAGSTIVSQYFGVLDFDIEREYGLSDMDYNIRKMDRLSVIVRLLQQRGFEHYQIFDSGRKGYHVYIYDMNRCWLVPEKEDVDRNLWIRHQLKELYGEELYDMIDLSNHHIGKGIRPYMCNHPVTGKPPSLIQATGECPSSFWEWFVECLYIGMTPKRAGLPSDLVTSTDSIASIESIELNHSSENIRAQEEINVRDAIVSAYPGGCRLADAREGLVTIKENDYCLIAGRHHKFPKNYAIIHTHHATVLCHSSNCKGNSKNVVLKTRPLTDTGDLIPIEQRRRIIGPDVPYILKEDIEWCLEGPGFGAVFAPMGSGKTKALEDWIEEKPKSFTYLLIVVRITQASYFSNRYADLVDYQKRQGNLHKVTRLVCCINSLERLLDDEGRLPHYDLLILDEIESIVAALVSKILSSGRSEQCTIWNIMGVLIKSAKRTLIMDGIPTHHSIDYFKGLNLFDKFSIVEHHRQPDFRTYKCHCHEASFMEEIHSDLRNGKNIVLVTNTKEVQAYIYSRIDSTYSKLMINADSEKKIKNTSKKPNEKWNVRFLAYNTAVGAGASFDVDHFNTMYAVVSPYSCTPQDFYQLICRIRKLKDKKVVMMVLSHGEDEKPVPTKEELKLCKMKNIKSFHWFQTSFRPSLRVLEFNATENVRLDICELDYKLIRTLSATRLLKLKHEDDFFLNTLIDFEHEKLCLSSHASYCTALFEMLRRNGGVVIEIKDHQLDILRISSRTMKQDARKLSDEMAVTQPNPRNRFWQPPDDFNPVLAKVWNKLVNFNDATTQFRWMALRNRLIKPENEVYEKELTDINRNNKALSNTMIFSGAVLAAFAILRTACGFHVHPELGIFYGRVSIMPFHTNKKRIFDAIKCIYNQVYSSTQLRMEVIEPAADDSDSAVNYIIWRNLKRMFKIFGINCIYHRAGNKRVMVNRRRMAAGEFEFCQTTQHIRMALAKLEYDTGERNHDAITYYLNKINSN
jgi:hypothetical protein